MTGPIQIVIGNYRYSSWSMRAWLAVNHSGLAYETVRIPLFTPESKEKLLALSPSGKVPVLIEDDMKVWDSAAIIDYCAMRTPERFWWPTETEAYAFARSICSEMHSGFQDLRENLPMDLLAARRGVPLDAATKADIDRIDAIWQECIERFGSTNIVTPGPFLFGAFSAADMMFAPVATRFISHGITPSRTARIYMAAISSYRPIDLWYAAAQHERERFAHIEALYRAQGNAAGGS